jgi:hypothetical protein
LENKKLDSKSLSVDVRKSFKNVTERGNRWFEYKKPVDNIKVEAYAKWKEECPKIAPGPQHYWKTLTFKETKGGKKKDDEVQNDDGEKKIYLCNRRKTDKALYKPMRSHIF